MDYGPELSKRIKGARKKLGTKTTAAAVRALVQAGLDAINA